MTISAMQTTVELNETRDYYRNRVTPPEKLAIMDRDTEELVASGIKVSALKEGDRVRDFNLHGYSRRASSSPKTIRKGACGDLFLSWWLVPYCNIELRGLQRVLPEITALGASLVAISPQLPDNSLSTEEKNHLAFPVLSDVGNIVARQFGIVYRLPDDLLETYVAFNHGLADMNGEDGATELPMPATYVLDPSGVVRVAFVDEDYTKCSRWPLQIRPSRTQPRG